MMSYASRRQLPKQVKQMLRGMPQAQELWREAYNTNHAIHGSGLRTYAMAWSAVREQYYLDDKKVWRRKHSRTN